MIKSIDLKAIARVGLQLIMLIKKIILKKRFFTEKTSVINDQSFRMIFLVKDARFYYIIRYLQIIIFQ